MAYGTVGGHVVFPVAVQAGAHLQRLARLGFHHRHGGNIAVTDSAGLLHRQRLVGLLAIDQRTNDIRIGGGKESDVGFMDEAHVVRQLRALPSALEDALAMEAEIAEVSRWFGDKQHALFLGRGAHYPVALEGALKLKEISYVHAEAYPAGELKHGPLALVDEEMPVVVVAPNDQLLEKLKSNMEAARARGGRLDRQSTRLNTSHKPTSYAAFCLKKKKENKQKTNNQKKNNSR